MRGFSGEPLFEVTFEGVEVAPDAVVAEVDGGWRALEPALDVATALLCAHIAGATRRVYEQTLDYAQRRVQFGQAIARFQRVQDHLVDMLNHADAARWTAYEAVWKLEQGRPEAREAVSVAKMVASEGFYQSCESAHHVHAGVGSDRAFGLYLYTQRSRALYHHLGDPAHHRRRLARLLFG
jgi:alkylation response protein AidB-like acyl-CoA dehydrogenase